MVKILLDNGHGYDTPGKRSPIWPDGSQLFEWEFNRDIVSRIEILLKKAGISCVRLVPEKEDISLSERCKRANTIANKVIVLKVLALAAVEALGQLQHLLTTFVSHGCALDTCHFIYLLSYL